MLAEIRETRYRKGTMARLINRQKQIPGGIFFWQPQTRWKSSPGSFDNTVQQIIAHRNGNRAILIDRDHLPTDQAGVENELDRFLANVCLQMGWAEGYVMDIGGGPPPKLRPPSQKEVSQLSAVAANVKKIWSGVRTLNDWIQSGEPAVDAAESERRATICVACPLNAEGGLEKWFTQPAAAVIKRQFEQLSERKLTTSLDDKLNVCQGCLCPMKLKVHVPAKYAKAHLTDAVIDALRKGKDCWVLALP